jgi:hypothetical protein
MKPGTSTKVDLSNCCRYTKSSLQFLISDRNILKRTEACMFPRYEDMKSSPSTYRTQQVVKITTTSLYIPCHFNKIYVIMSRYGILTFLHKLIYVSTRSSIYVDIHVTSKNYLIVAEGFFLFYDLNFVMSSGEVKFSKREYLQAQWFYWRLHYWQLFLNVLKLNARKHDIT